MLVLALMLVGCHKKQKDHQPKVDVKEVETLQKEVDVTINRYECDLFSDEMKSLADKVVEEARQPNFAPQKGMSDNMKALSDAVAKLHDKYPEELIQDGVWNEPMMLLQLTNYLRDPVIKDIYQNAITMYPSLDDVEKEIEQALRVHRIPYSYSTDGGALHIRVPVRSGSVRIVRTCSRSAPFQVRQTVPVPDLYPFPVPVLHPEY